MFGTCSKFLPLVALCFAGPLGAQVRGAPSADSLAARYVAALRTGDTATERALTHPASLACPTFGDSMLVAMRRWTKERTRPKIDGPFRTKVFTMDDSVSKPGAKIYLPVAASQQLQIDFTGTNFAILRRAARDHGRWFIVDLCFTDEGLADLRKGKIGGL